MLIVTILYILYIVLFVTKDQLIYYLVLITVISSAFDITWLYYAVENFKTVSIRNVIVKILGVACIFAFVKKPEDLWFDFDGLVDFEEYDKIRNMKLSIHEVLEKAFDLYKKIYKDYYKIEIIDDSTNEVVDYIEESEVR